MNMMATERQPSSPLCQNCLMTELYCAATRDLERRPCCKQCEHIRLGPNEAEALGMETTP